PTEVTHSYTASTLPSSPRFRHLTTSLCLFSFFFFSSRRRHTRWPRDWSSDVCSSDLVLATRGGAQGDGQPETRVPRGKSQLAHRSEERRVGKECRSRWSPEH